MKNELYYITCITNLHVGSGEANYNIIDKEVEKDPITGYPTIHASGIKGALRDIYTGNDEIEIFGAPAKDAANVGSGAIRFLNANLLYRPMRATGNTPYINVTTIDILKSYVELCENFGIKNDLRIPKIAFGVNKFMASRNTKVEGEATGNLDESQIAALSGLLGGNFAIAKSFDGFDLPVIARNNLTENRNLWYEEYVPHGSRFYFFVINTNPTEIEYDVQELVQLGGNSSIGYGYCKFEKQGENNNE